MLMPSPEAHKVGNGDALEVMLAGKGLKVRPPQHVAVCGVDDLRDDPHGLAASQAGQVHRCLCVAWALQHASLPAASGGLTAARLLQWLRCCMAPSQQPGQSVQQCQLSPQRQLCCLNTQLGVGLQHQRNATASRQQLSGAAQRGMAPSCLLRAAPAHLARKG